jgi:hypothetical protein
LRQLAHTTPEKAINISSSTRNEDRSRFIGWFIEHPKIPAAIKNPRKQQSAALAARQVFDAGGDPIRPQTKSA